MTNDIFLNIFNYIKANWVLIPISIIVLIILKIIISDLLIQHRMRKHQKWLWKQEKKKAEKKQKQEEKEKNKYRTYRANNWLYNDILQYRTIVFKGLPGTGKTSGAMNFAKFLVDKLLFNELKNRHYYEVMNPEFLKKRDELIKNNQMPIYTNMENVRDLSSGKTAIENAENILFQRQKANTPCIVVLDECSDILGKDNYMKVQHEKDPEKRADNDGAKQTAKKLRHMDMWLFMTDQGGNDVVFTVRGVGFQTLEYLETKRELSDKGKRKQKWLLWKIKWLMGWFVSKPKIRFAECLFAEQKKQVFFKLFLSGYKYFEKQYFTSRNKIYEEINLKYIVWKQLFKWKDKCYWFHYNNFQTLLYDHKEFKSEYNNKFDDEGNRKKTMENNK